MNEPIASLLHAVRQKKGVSLREISEATKISLYHLEAIEKCDFRKLPGGIYATSYIRQYARAIGFDEFELLARYHEVTGAPPALPQIERVQNPSQPGFRPLFQH